MRPLATALLALLAARAATAAGVDLMTAAGLESVQGTWRVAEATIAPVEFRLAGADGQPGERRAATFDVVPRAGVAGFDDSAWEVVPPVALAVRRGGGELSFVWYRLRFTLPDRFDGADPAGSTLTFETAVDDAAEVWVDGELRRCPGQRGGSMVAGWNAPNRIVLTRDARSGQRFEIAVFGINGPLSGSPTNYVWMHAAKLELAATAAGESGPLAVSPACEENLEVERFDPRLDAIVPRNPKAFVIADGFSFTEGPVWVPASGSQLAHLLFSEPNANRIWKWTPGGELEVFREKSGYDGADIARYRQPGSNGLALDPQGRLTIDEHGRRRVSRIERDGTSTILADRFDGKRLNSPNDLAYRSDGSLYFTDPFFGLPGFEKDPAKELSFQGVYRIARAQGKRPGEVELLTKALSGPNGIAFSPDEKWLYVGDWDDRHKAVVRYPVLANGRLGTGDTFVDLTAKAGEDAIDGVKTDELGDVYISGPGGLWIFAPDGTALGLLRLPRHPHNMAWGEDGKVLYLTARDQVYRMPLLVRGAAR